MTAIEIPVAVRRPAVFLDRDGVLNEAFVYGGVPFPPRHVEDFRLLPGVSETCAALVQAGLVLVVVTNQPEIRRGTLGERDLIAMHRMLSEALPVDDIVTCVHDDIDGCPCRKPRPGMILDAARRLDLDLNRSVSVGDRWRDIEAARRADVRAVYIEGGHGEPLRGEPDATFGSLHAAQEYILEASGRPCTT